jgi:hypothetical protein
MRPLRRRLASTALLSALTLTSACTKKTDEPAASDSAPDPAPADDAEPAPAPTPAPVPDVAQPPADSASAPIGDLGEVVATLQVPTGTAVSDLSAAIDTVKPGASGLVRLQLPQLLGQAVGVDLGGANLSAPISILAVNPSAHNQPLALLVEVDDLDTLKTNVDKAGRELREREGVALIGTADVVAATEAFAFANLRKQPSHTELVIYPKTLLAAFKPQIDQSLAQLSQTFSSTGTPGMGKFIGLYVETLVNMAEQTERVVVSVSPSTSSVDLFMRLYPKPGSTLAAFTAAQVPGDHSLLTKLPATKAPPAVLSGSLNAGAAKDRIVAWSIEFMASIYGTEFEAQAWTELFDRWLTTLDGRFAMAIEMDFANPQAPDMDMWGLMGSTDAETMRAAWREMATAMGKLSANSPAIMGMGMDLSFKEGAAEHDGVSADLFETKLDLSQLPPAQRQAMEATGNASQAMYFAAYDQFGAMASADPDAAALRALIDSSRGKAQALEPDAELKATLAASQAMGESLIYYFDIGSIIPPEAKGEIPFESMAMGMGKHGEALSMRFSMRK